MKIRTLLERAGPSPPRTVIIRPVRRSFPQLAVAGFACLFGCPSPSPVQQEAEQNTAKPASDDGAAPSDGEAPDAEPPTTQAETAEAEAGSGSTDSTDGGSEGTTTAAAPYVEARQKRAEERAKADLVRAGNLAVDLTEALKSGKLENVLSLTPFDGGEFAKACEHAGLLDEREVIARAKFCLRTVDWSDVTDVRVTGGGTSKEPAVCTDYDPLQRIRLLVVSPKGNTIIEIQDPFGRDGQAVGFSGAMVCRSQE